MRPAAVHAPAVVIAAALSVSCVEVLGPFALPQVDARIRSIVLVLERPAGVEAFAADRAEAHALGAALSEGLLEAAVLLYEADLTALGLDPGFVALETEGSCRPPAPSSVLSGRIEGGELVWTERSSLGGAAAAVRFRTRPGRTIVGPEGRAVVDIGCPGKAPCGEITAEQDGCRLVLDATACARGTLEGSIDGLGRVQLESTQLGACRERARAPDARLGLECEPQGLSACRLDVYAEPFPQRFTADVVALPALVSSEPIDQVTPFSANVGFLTGLAAFEDRVLVATTGGRMRHINRWSCGRERSELVSIDLETLATRASTAAPGCIVALEPDPSGTGIVAALGTEGRRSIARLDLDGRVAGARSFEELDPEWADFVPIVLRVIDPTLVALGLRSTAQPSRGVMVLIDWPAMQVRTSTTFERDLIDIEPIGDDLIAVVDTSERINLFSRSGEWRGRRHFPSALGAGISRVATALFHHRETERFIAAFAGGAPAVHAADPREISLEMVARFGLFFERHADPTALAAWPGAPDRLVVGLAEQGPDRAAILALFDPIEARFLPGALVLPGGGKPPPEGPRGPVMHLREDGRGRIWFALPWSSQVVRVSPAP